jgi:hypothetical protein
MVEVREGLGICVLWSAPFGYSYWHVVPIGIYSLLANILRRIPAKEREPFTPHKGKRIKTKLQARLRVVEMRVQNATIHN